MRIVVNGAPRDVDDGLPLGELVDQTVKDRRGVAVAVDGQVVTRSQWDTTPLSADAKIEILAAVQGG